MASNEKIINKYLKAAKKDCPKRLQKMLDTELKGSLIEFCNDKVRKSFWQTRAMCSRIYFFA